jgi:hypothetical protein
MTALTLTAPLPPRRGFASFRSIALAAFAAFGLAACGGGGGSGGGTPPTSPVQPPPGGNPPVQAPAIQEFTADKAAYGIGEIATLTVRFTGGTGRIEPEIGPVQSGTPVRTSKLDGTREYRLVVESTTAPAVSRTLRLSVDYRDRYAAHPAQFRASGHTATLADDGRVVLIGGSRGTSTPSFSIDVYDPVQNGFRQIGELRNGRLGHRAVRLTDGRILVTGGLPALDRVTAELVNERTGATVETGAPRVQRIGHTATHLGNGRVLVVGGATAGENAPFGISNTAEIYDVATGQFRLLASRLTMRRANHGAVLLGDGRVLLVGGFTPPGTAYQVAEVFDPRTETFTAVGAVDNVARGLQATVRLPDGSVLVLGGESPTGEGLARVQRFDGTTLASAQLANLLRPRTMVEGEVSRDGRVFLFGGEAGTTPVATETAESYSAATGPVAIASLPRPRFGHTVTRLRDGRFLIVGGEDRSGNFDVTPLFYE